MSDMKEMTAKRRLLNAMTGKEVDRMPWAPFLAYYWDFLDESTRKKGMAAYYREMGADSLLRGTSQLHSVQWNQCEIRREEKANKRCIIYETKVGSLTETYTYSATANSWFLTGHPVKEEEDFKTLLYLYEHMGIEENLAEFEEAYKELGEEGLILPVIGTNMKTAFQAMVEHWCGTENLVYALCDYPETVEECLHAMREKDRRTVETALKSPAEGFIFWEDTSTTNISPAYFEQYVLPQINEWADLLHQDNRLLVHHACGHLRKLMTEIGSSRIDVLESISPPPTGNITPEEIRAALPERIALIGGIEPVFLLNSTRQELIEQVSGLIRDMKESRYVLANSDSCPPKVEYGKFADISRLVRELG